MRMEITTLVPWFQAVLLIAAIALGLLLQEHSTSKVDKWLFRTGLSLSLVVGILGLVPQNSMLCMLMPFSAFVIFALFYTKHLPLHRRASKYETTYG
jgi:hypothetical protein